MAGRFQLEAAIQAVHCDRARNGTTDVAVLRTLYAALLTVAPSLGARVAHATVVGRIDGPEAGLALLEDLGDDLAFQPLYAVRAHLLATAGEHDRARAAYGRAIGLAEDTAVRSHLEARRDQAADPHPPV